MTHAEQFDPTADLTPEQAAAVAIAQGALAVTTAILFKAVPFPMTYETLQARVHLDEAFMWLTRGLKESPAPDHEPSTEEVHKAVADLLRDAFNLVAEQNRPTEDR